jgi:PAS domain S-box-containing protein
MSVKHQVTRSGNGNGRSRQFDRVEAEQAREQLRIQADILRNVRESVIVTDLDGRITHWNDGATAVFGYSSSEMLGSAVAIIYPDQPATAEADLHSILDGTDFKGEWQGRRKDGEMVSVNVHTSVMRDADGSPTGFIGLASDVSELRASDKRLARLAAAVEQASDSIVIANALAEIEYVNPAFERITGYRREDVIGRNTRILKSGRQPESFYQAMWASLAAGQPWVADFTNRRADGSLFEEEATISPIRDDAGEITGYVAVKRDVTSERHLQSRAERLARERALIADTIRGISGRETPEETAEAICQQRARMGDVATSGLSIFELDGRLATYGFSVAGGPTPKLRRVPRRRTGYLRGRADQGPWVEAWENRPWHPYNDTFMELGVQGIAYAPISDRGKVVGFLHLASAAENWQERLTEQLPALVEFAGIAGTLIGSRVAERFGVEAVRERIRRTLRAEAFTVVFQPIVDLRAGTIVGYEALTRFADGVAPDVRFAEAQKVGLGGRLEMATLRVAIEAARDLPAGAWLNLNTSPQLILASSHLREIIAAAGRPIVLEITEHVAIADYVAFRRAMERLGPEVRIAIDDAGAGYASLNHILELRPDFVKLDRAIVMGLEVDEARAALVAGMGHFAHSTGMRLVAEGVETEAELAVLRRLDVDLAQGYLLGRPEPVHVVRRGRAAVGAPRRSRRRVRGATRAGQRGEVDDAHRIG